MRISIWTYQPDFTSVFGPNGRSESTLLSMMTGFVAFHSGRIQFNGRPVRDVKIG
jgi:ABC-type Mn2+/Zn2+ transport system ATPase subunit